MCDKITNMKYFKNIFFLIILLSIFLSCATNEKEEEKPIVIERIDLLPSVNRSPKFSNFQIDVELVAKISSDNLNQDIIYEWFIDEIKLDIQSNLNESQKAKDDTDISDNKSDRKDLSNDLSDDSFSLIKKSTNLEKKKNIVNYYLYTSNNPLNCMLSIFKPGYYKVTLRASNTKEVKEKSVIVKAGAPDLPELLLKLNVPDVYYADNSNDKIKGKIFLRFESFFQTMEGVKKDFIKIEAKDLQNGWYNTNIKVNTFYSFKITAGTHIVEGDDNILYITSLGKTQLPAGYDSIYFDFLDKKGNIVTNSPIILKNFDKSNLLTIYRKGAKKWKEGDLFLSYLMWGINSEKKEEEFIISENVLNEDNKIITTYLDNKFLVKIYIGSIGIRSKSNDFFVFFSPDGLDSNEFDTKKERDLPGLPFGFLIGKLGENGKVFPIGSGYTYLYSNSIPIFYLDQSGRYVELKEKSSNNKENSKK